MRRNVDKAFGRSIKVFHNVRQDRGITTVGMLKLSNEKKKALKVLTAFLNNLIEF